MTQPNAPLFVAQKRAFYAEAALSLDVVLIPGLQENKAFIGGSADFASVGNSNCIRTLYIEAVEGDEAFIWIAPQRCITLPAL